MKYMSYLAAKYIQKLCDSFLKKYRGTQGCAKIKMKIKKDNWSRFF